MKFAKVFLIFSVLIISFFLVTHKTSNSNAHAAINIKIHNTNRNKNTSRVPILIYHHILNKLEKPWINNEAVIDTKEFDSQMKYLYDHHYHTATLPDIVDFLQEKKSLPPKTVVITFDDGYKSNYLYAYPVLKKYGFKATEFLIVGKVAKQPVPFNPKGLQYLSWPEVNTMKDVFQFASHTYDLHGNYKGKHALLTEPNNVILKDAEASRIRLNNTDFFAYPFGSYDNKLIQVLKEAGYKYAFTTTPNDVQIGDSPFEIPRKTVKPNITLSHFISMLR